MLSYGTNIQGISDQLQKVQLDFLFNSIRNSSSALQSKIRQLRIVKDIDTRQYANLKKTLPYIVCSIFNPPYRRTENFAYTEYFFLDLDHVSEAGKDLVALRQSLQQDSRVVMSFVSPSLDGLKLLFRLSERCWDTGIYSLFYKTFARQFALQYHLEEVLDTRTSDVCRACFLSYDPDVYFNPDAEPVNIHAFVDINDVSSMFELKRELEKKEKEETKEKELNAAQSGISANDTTGPDPSMDTLEKIKQVLALSKSKPSLKSDVFVPNELDQIIDSIRTMFEENGLMVSSVGNIQYGKNIKLNLGVKKAELNLFYGKRGFTVVQCPRAGTNAEMNELCSELLRMHLQKIA